MFININSLYFNIQVNALKTVFKVVNKKNGRAFQLQYRLANKGYKDKELTGLDCALNFILGCYTTYTIFDKESIPEKYLDWWLYCKELVEVLELNSYSDAVLLREAL